MKGYKANLIGQRFERLLVIRPKETTPSGTIWEVRCDCGETRFLKTSRLTSGEQKSCGCLRLERILDFAEECKVNIIDGKRKCAKCKEDKLISDFSKSKKTSSGLQTRCKDCGLAYDWSNTHNISFEQAQTLVKISKDSSCTVCHKKGEVHLDHDHETGVLRGFLCGLCNRALGMLRDNPKIIIGLHNYLMRDSLHGIDSLLSGRIDNDFYNM